MRNFAEGKAISAVPHQQAVAGKIHIPLVKGDAQAGFQLRSAT